MGKAKPLTNLRNGHTRITIINSPDKIHYFSNIVSQIMPSIHPELEEDLNMKPIGNLIKSFEQGVSMNSRSIGKIISIGNKGIIAEVYDNMETI